eukprot:1195784-Prorocentrum_minimum.AAC.7
MRLEFVGRSGPFEPPPIIKTPSRPPSVIRAGKLGGGLGVPQRLEHPVALHRHFGRVEAGHRLRPHEGDVKGPRLLGGGSGDGAARGGAVVVHGQRRAGGAELALGVARRPRRHLHSDVAIARRRHRGGEAPPAWHLPPVGEGPPGPPQPHALRHEADHGLGPGEADGEGRGPHPLRGSRLLSRLIDGHHAGGGQIDGPGPGGGVVRLAGGVRHAHHERVGPLHQPCACASTVPKHVFVTACFVHRCVAGFIHRCHQLTNQLARGMVRYTQGLMTVSSPTGRAGWGGAGRGRHLCR